ncbi:MAG: DMT family transporter, partial [Planctomycetota bacterium]
AGTISGFLLACQPGVNGALRSLLPHPLHASLTSFTVGLSCALIACLAVARALPKPSDYAGAPWWTLTGGGIGFFLVTTSLIFAPKVGAGAWLGTLVVAQLAGAVLLDHYGLAGYEVRTATWVRLAGVALMIGGVVMVLKG